MPDTKQYRYLGPSDFFIKGDQTYRKGDLVPLSEEEMNHHRLYGSSQFEGYEQVFTAPVNGSPEDMVPSDDMGRPHLLSADGKILKPGSGAWKDAMAAKGMPKEAIAAQVEAAKAAESAPTALVGAKS